MATTTIPAVKAALYDLLKAELSVRVEWARPSEDALPLESVFFAGVKSTQAAEAMGNQRRDETYTFELVVAVHRDGDDPRACELRMWEIVSAIEAVVRANPRPIPAPLFDVQYAGVEQQPHQAEGQRISDAVIRIAARARI